MSRIVDLAIDDIAESKTNPRRLFNQQRLQELADSIAAQGVLQPVLVRKREASKDEPEPYELIFGARRKRAATLAKQKTIPAIVSDMDDEAVAVAQAVENGQREDVHPLEEADGYKQLIERFNWTVDRIAAKVGKSESYVYATLKLCALADPGREAFFAGKIDKSVAMLVARIPNKALQERATAEILKGWNDEPWTFRQAADHVHRHYMLQLAGAPFDAKDKDLVPDAGSCADCPKRTGNQRELFQDVSRADVCTDPACFRLKVDAAWKAAAAHAEEKGQKVLDEKDTKKAFPFGNAALSHDAPFVDLGAICFDDPKQRTYKQLLGKKAPVVLARDPTGGIRSLVAKDEVKPLLKAAGHDFKASRASGGADLAAKREREKQARRRAATAAIIGAAIDKIDMKTPGLWRLIVDLIIEQGFSDAIGELVKRREWTEKKQQAATVFRKRVAELDDTMMPGVVIELLLGRRAYFSFSEKISPDVMRVAKAAGVDAKRAQAAALKAEAPKKPKKKAARK